MMKNIIAIIILITIDTFQTHDTPVKISRMVYYILRPVFIFHFQLSILLTNWLCNCFFFKKKFEDTKVLIRSLKSKKNGQYTNVKEL